MQTFFTASPPLHLRGVPVSLSCAFCYFGVCTYLFSQTERFCCFIRRKLGGFSPKCLQYRYLLDKEQDIPNLRIDPRHASGERMEEKESDEGDSRSYLVGQMLVAYWPYRHA
mmetsp:Transcript_18936/g.44070  ORF Transcript_18936/g.44070 Transcript_18936/m.44070 type:complete len:112 (-) Transcript_18936:452-787(-)